LSVILGARHGLSVGVASDLTAPTTSSQAFPAHHGPPVRAIRAAWRPPPPTGRQQDDTDLRLAMLTPRNQGYYSVPDL